LQCYVDAVYYYRRSSAVCLSVCLSTNASPAKTADSITMAFGIRTRMVPRKHVLGGVHIPTPEGAILIWRPKPRTRPKMSGGRYTQRNSTSGQHRYGADADWGVLDRVHIGAIWRIRLRLDRPCAAAMRPYVKLL